MIKRTVNSISGGQTSALIYANYPADYNIFSLVCIDDVQSRMKDAKMVQWVNDKLGKSYTDRFGEFIATAEDDRTLFALRNIEQHYGREITWVRGRSFDDVIEGKNSKGYLSRLPGKQFRVCTSEMKILPIFLWCWLNLGEKVSMRIGYRFDEFNRIEKFYNASPNHYRIPVSCKNYGERKQVLQSVNWREVHFPLAKDGIDKAFVKFFWKDRAHIAVFPPESNCVGCFWKDEETIAAMAGIHPEKLEWFASKEDIGKGTWKQGTTYRNLIDNREDLAKERFYELTVLGESCGSEGCTN